MTLWFGRNPEATITIRLLCMKCNERFEITVSLTKVQLARGLCPCCQTVLEWMKPPHGERYLEFLYLDCELTRKDWIVRP